jgi:threonine/homoserine/homoserine lactone efflux protein
MPIDTFIALLIFAFVASATPGPNNVMLLASGVNFGFRRTIPHMLGIAKGFATLLLSVGFGLGALLVIYPDLYVVLKFLGGAYLLHLAWRIAMTRVVASGNAGKTPMTLWAAAAFQWVNPKAWMMAVTAMSLYTSPEMPYVSVVLVALAFVLVNFPSVSIWAGCGTALRSFLADPEKLKWFNITMGAVLALTTIPMVL